MSRNRTFRLGLLTISVPILALVTIVVCVHLHAPAEAYTAIAAIGGVGTLGGGLATAGHGIRHTTRYSNDPPPGSVRTPPGEDA